MSVREFYDALAPWYELVYADWNASSVRQADALAAIIAEEWAPERREVFDAAMGIGTQALPLVQRGFQVTGADLSPVAVRRAGALAKRGDLRIRSMVSDMRALPLRSESVDVVIACDNAIPHLLTLEDIKVALGEFLRCTRPGGGCILSVREHVRTPEPGTVEQQDYGVRSWQGRACRLRQVWHWRGELYDLHFEVHAEDPAGVMLERTPSATYFAIAPARIAELMREVGFQRVRQDDGVMFQPVLVGTR